ncbi:MAG: integrase [Stutzerimonas stutzeri]|nr:MAG: integrase [Stutzerimonas stutzeri]
MRRRIYSASLTHTLIPVLVTGILPTRVCAAKKYSSQPKDLVGLDLCDRHRDEGGG